MIALRSLIVLLIVSLMGAFAAAQERSADAPRGQEETAAKQDKPVDSPPIVELLEPGEEPRRELRYALKSGAEQSIIMAMQSTMEQRAAGIPIPPTRMPEMRFTIESSIDRAGSGDEFHGRVRYADAEVEWDRTIPPRAMEIMQQVAETMKGRSAEIRLTPRGEVRSLKLDGAPTPGGMMMGDPAETIRQTLHDAVVLFPVEPLGVGARWSVKRTGLMNNFIATQTTFYTITRMEGDTIELAVESTQAADPQPIEARGMPQQMRLASFESAGSGTKTISLASLMPLKSDRSTQAEMELEVGQSTAPQKLQQKVQSKTSISPAEKAKKDDAEPKNDDSGAEADE